MVEYIITLRIHQCTRPYDGIGLKVLNHSVIGQACETTISWSFRRLNRLCFEPTIFTYVLTYLCLRRAIQAPFFVSYATLAFSLLFEQCLTVSRLKTIKTCSRFQNFSNAKRFYSEQDGIHFSTFCRYMMRIFHCYLRKDLMVKWLGLVISFFR